MADEKKAKKTSEKKSGEKKARKNPFKAIGAFFKSVRSEGKKVTWPKAKEVWKNTLVVLVVILIVGLAIFGVDRLLSLGMKGIKQLAESKTTTSAETTTQSAADALSSLLGGDTDTSEDTSEGETEAASEAETEADTTEAQD